MFPWLTVAKYAAIVIVSIGIGVGVTAKIKNGEIAELKLADAQSEFQTLSAGTDFIVNSAAAFNKIGAEFASSIDHIQFMEVTTIKEVKVYVTAETDAKYPIPCGAMRVRDAAIAGQSPAALDPNQCGPDGGPAPIVWSDLSASEVQLIYDKAANDKQLIDLQRSVTALYAEYDKYAAIVNGTNPQP